MFEKLKKRWGIESNYQVVIILTVFAVTGSLTVILKKQVFELLGITPETNLLLKVPLYVVTILVVYNVLLLAVGSVFGQFRFFMAFEKKFFSRLFLVKTPNRKLNTSNE